MSQRVAVSKFRNIYGTAHKKTECFEGLPVTSNMFENNYAAANPKFLAVATKQTGCFTILDINKPGRITNHARILHSGSQLMDLKWNPFDDHMIATAADDGTIKVWQIPEAGLKEGEDLEPVRNISVHKKRVSCIEWHPSAANIIASCSNDQTVCVLDIGAESASDVLVCQTASHGESVFQVTWDHTGEKLFSFAKDYHLRSFNPRTGELIQKGASPAHASRRPTKIASLGKSNVIATTGFNKSNQPEVKLHSQEDLDTCYETQNCGEGSGCVFMMFDADINVLYLYAKGDSTIRYMELVHDEHTGHPKLFVLFQFSGGAGHKSCCTMPKRGLEIMHCEIARFYRLCNSSNIIEPVVFTVPRKTEDFHPDIYPDTPDTTPALTSAEWREGKSSEPKLVDIQTLIGKEASSGGLGAMQEGNGHEADAQSAKLIGKLEHELEQCHSLQEEQAAALEECEHRNAQLVEEVAKLKNMLMDKEMELEELMMQAEANKKDKEDEATETAPTEEPKDD